MCQWAKKRPAAWAVDQRVSATSGGEIDAADIERFGNGRRWEPVVDTRFARPELSLKAPHVTRNESSVISAEAVTSRPVRHHE